MQLRLVLVLAIMVVPCLIATAADSPLPSAESTVSGFKQTPKGLVSANHAISEFTVEPWR